MKKQDRRVAIVGAGPIGLAAILTSQLYSPSHIVAIDLADSRLEAARKFGALQGNNPVATGALYRQGVNAAAPDSLDDLLGFVVASSFGAHNGDTTSALFGAIFCQRCFLAQSQIFPEFSLPWSNGTRKRNIGIFVYK